MSQLTHRGTNAKRLRRIDFENKILYIFKVSRPFDAYIYTNQDKGIL
jgi:hypothetical protein